MTLTPGRWFNGISRCRGTSVRRFVAVTRLRELTVRTDAGLRVHAPKQTVIAGRHGMVALGIDEKSLPTKRGAQMRMAGIKP